MAQIEAFVRRCGSLVDRMKRVGDWGHEVVRSGLVAIGRGHGEGASIAEYLEAVSGFDRGERFEAMVESLRPG